jgi:hypothetical protein
LQMAPFDPVQFRAHPVQAALPPRWCVLAPGH